jgi:uncharacterized membrane protein
MQSTKLTHAALLAAVVGATAAFTASGASAADATPIEKCYGVSKAADNSCASKAGNHGCAGQSKAAYSGQEFKAVPKGTCEKMMGSLTPFDGTNPKIKG